MNQPNNYRKSQYDRAADDWFVEPAWCVETMIDALEWPPGLFWDPCCGGGTIPSAFASRFGEARVLGTDIVDRGYPRLGGLWDATSLEMHSLTDLGDNLNIVTNPPFKIAEQIVRNLLPHCTGQMAILQQLSFLASRARYRLFRDFLPAEVLVLSQRPSMPPGHMIEELGDMAFKGGTTDFCWIVWRPPHVTQTTISWLPPRGER